MINAIRKLREAYGSYNPATGEGANELLKAYIHYQVKDREVEDALQRVQKILDERKGERK